MLQTLSEITSLLADCSLACIIIWAIVSELWVSSYLDGLKKCGEILELVERRENLLKRKIPFILLLFAGISWTAKTVIGILKAVSPS